MRTVVITGANRGIGLEFARQYAADGARVLACCRTPDAADDLNQLHKAHNDRLSIYELDVGSAASVASFAAEIASTPVDILINNAGVYGGTHQRVGDIDYEQWLHTMNVNTLGPVRVTEALLPNLAKGREKKVVAISSTMGSTARHDGGALIYRSSKAALNNAMKGLSLALKNHGLTVAILHPGWVKTDMGGAGATLSPEMSVSALRKIIEALSPARSGVYLSFDESKIDW